MELRRKRAYDTASDEDGFRVLVDGLWPRGVSKDRAAIDLWAKGIAPSAELRRDWHAASDSEFEMHAQHYRDQLAHESAQALRELADELKRHPIVTLIYALHDTERNHAVVLEAVLRERLR